MGSNQRSGGAINQEFMNSKSAPFICFYLIAYYTEQLTWPLNNAPLDLHSTALGSGFIWRLERIIFIGCTFPLEAIKYRNKLDEFPILI